MIAEEQSAVRLCIIHPNDYAALLQQIARGEGISDPRKSGVQRHIHFTGLFVMFVRAEARPTVAMR